MDEIEDINIKLSIRNYYAFTAIVGSSLFKLTDAERICLANFLELKYRFGEKNPFSSENKKKVAKAMNFGTNTINVYIKKLKDKKAIRETDFGYDFHPYIRPSNSITFKCKWDV